MHEVETRIEQIAEFPESGAPYEDEVRRVLVHGGLYSLLYLFDHVLGIVTVVGCFNNRTDPAPWRYYTTHRLAFFLGGLILGTTKSLAFSSSCRSASRSEGGNFFGAA